MKKHVTSLELAKQLKEAGYPQEGKFWWHEVISIPEQRIDGSEVTTNHRESSGFITPLASDTPDGGFRYIAPLATELLEHLPNSIGGKEKPHFLFNLTIIKSPLRYHVLYNATGTDHDLKEIEGELLSDALAEMWLYLKKENLL